MQVQNIPLAVLLQTIGSFCFALSAFFQHSSVRAETGHNVDREAVSGRALLQSMKNPRWLLGLLLMGVSLVCQLTALTMAPLSVVQPIGLLAFPWSIILQARAAKRGVPFKVMMSVALTVAATFAFTVLVSVNATDDASFVVSRVVIGAIVVYICAAALGSLGMRGPTNWRSLAWASGGAVFYGLEAALAKSLMEFAKHADWMHDPVFWGILAALVIGSATAGWMVQQGYATGPAELVVASMTITSPVVAVIYGVAVLGEGKHYTTMVTGMMIFLGMLAIGGVVNLTRMQHEFAAFLADPDAPSPLDG